MRILAVWLNNSKGVVVDYVIIVINDYALHSDLPLKSQLFVCRMQPWLQIFFFLFVESIYF